MHCPRHPAAARLAAALAVRTAAREWVDRDLRGVKKGRWLGHLSTPISLIPTPFSRLALVCKRGETYPDGYGRPSARPTRQTGGTANQARDGRPPRPKRSRVAGRGRGRHSAGARCAARQSAAQSAGARYWIADRASRRDDAQLRRDPSHAFRRRRQRDRRAVANGNLSMPAMERRVNHTEARRKPERNHLASKAP